MQITRCISSYMNLDEAVELLRVVSAIPVKDSAKRPEIRILYNQGEGYTLHIEAHLVNDEHRSYLNGIVESRKLGIRESEGYIVIYG
jgi:hypothetical protein